MYGPLGFLFDLPYGNVTDQFSKDPTEIWVAARTLAAVLCMAGVVATYSGRAGSGACARASWPRPSSPSRSCRWPTRGWR